MKVQDGGQPTIILINNLSFLVKMAIYMRQ